MKLLFGRVLASVCEAQLRFFVKNCLSLKIIEFHRAEIYFLVFYVGFVYFQEKILKVVCAHL